MNMNITRFFDFKDISIVPNQVSHIISRSNESIKTDIELFPNTWLKTPIVASPMKDVCDGNIAKKIRDLGGYGIIHRFCTIEDQVKEFNISKDCGCAIGINGDYLERYATLIAAGCKNFCIDVANGASISVENAITKFLEIAPAYFMVGNVASDTCYNWCGNLSNVANIRVGIAGGAGCTTKNATGIYTPMASLIDSCRKNYTKNIVADGGIKEPSDFCKAMAVGADCIMLGSAIAKAVESPAKVIVENGISYKAYSGSASYEIQKTYRDMPRYIEGRSVLLEYREETLEQIVNRFMEGLRSSMSYLNATSIKEYQSNVRFCEV